MIAKVRGITLGVVAIVSLICLASEIDPNLPVFVRGIFGY